MSQLTVHGLDAELGERLERLARERELSLSRAAVLLMRLGAGLGTGGRSPHPVGDALDDFVGLWTDEEEAAFLDSIGALGRADDSARR